MSVEITCITKDGGNHYNPYEAIERFGWYNPYNGQKGFANMSEMIDFLEKGNKAYVVDPLDKNDRAYLEVQERNGTKFVRTIADGERPDNLLELPECVR